MEKSGVMKLAKILLFIFYLLVVISILTLEIWNKLAGRNTQVSPYLYWMVIIGWLVIVYRLKAKSDFSLKPSYILLITSSIVIILGWKSVGEILMKLSFIGWIIGITQSLFESLKTS